jgi:predicted lipid-binding transport protein (Tim44 family)
VDGGFPYGDIIVIGAIAAFIILRYRAMLGEKSGRDSVDIARPRTLDTLEPVIQLPERDKTKKVDAKAAIKDSSAFAETYVAMRAIDDEFSPDEFIEGSKGAYEMVIGAFNDADYDTLKMLLSDRIFKEFKGHLEANEKAGRRAHTTLVAIVSAKVSDAKLRGNTATMTVDFQSEQIPLVRDKDDAIIEGNVSHQEAIEDQWVFERNLANSDPNWKIIET